MDTLGHEARCTVCGGNLRQPVSGDKGAPWNRRDLWLWLAAFPGGELFWVVAAVLALTGIVFVAK